VGDERRAGRRAVARHDGDCRLYEGALWGGRDSSERASASVQQRQLRWSEARVPTRRLDAPTPGGKPASRMRLARKN
jgi:hypothetical protein